MIHKWERNLEPGLNIPALMWIPPSELDDECKKQIRNLMKLPFAVHHIAVMPDAHGGYGMPIGTVLATRDVIIPNAVGVDIGCGMIAAKLMNVTQEDVRRQDENLREEILLRIPVGFCKRERPAGGSEMPNLRLGQVTNHELSNARLQLGTLGGGNHFIEIQFDDANGVWAMIHSGSRNLGKQVCDFYAKWAKEENARNFSSVPADADLGFFSKGHTGFDEYLDEMNYCVAYAKQNRAKMMLDVMRSFQLVFGEHVCIPGSLVFDICHNHAAYEYHMGKNVWVHRKGAAGPYFNHRVGIIPGSMGAKSYLVTHKDAPESFASTSHGAGRRMSRKAAKANLDLEREQNRMENMHVLCNLGAENLDEAPGAYKNIAYVMENQKDLVKIQTELTPVISIKG